MDHKKYVIFLGYSFSAFTAIIAARPELQVKSRREKGFSGKIIGIFYECSFLILVGESIYSFFQPKDSSETIIPLFYQFYIRLPSLAIP